MNQSNKKYNFIIMAGGTGGHIFPALAVAQTLQKQGHNVIWLGSSGAMETRIVPQYNITLETLNIRGVRGNGLMRKLKLPYTLYQTTRTAIRIFKQYQIDCAIGFGGFVSFPGGLACKILNRPLIIHEQNAIAGLSNKVLAKIASRVLYAFPNALPYPDGLTGNPVRAEITQIPPPEQRFAHRQGALKLLILGGSLGASVFNTRLPEIIARLPENKRPIILHQCGRDKSQPVKETYKNHNITADCRDFIDNMAQAYQDADYIICRAGALTIAELSSTGLGGFFVPYPYAVDDHQTHNAKYLVNHGAGECIPQDQFTVENMVEKLSSLSREDCLRFAHNARELALPNSAQKVAQIALDCLG